MPRTLDDLSREERRAIKRQNREAFWAPVRGAVGLPSKEEGESQGGYARRYDDGPSRETGGEKVFKVIAFGIRAIAWLFFGGVALIIAGGIVYMIFDVIRRQF